MMMNEVEKMATEMPKKKRPHRCIARDHEWLMPSYRFNQNTVEEQIKKIREEVEEISCAYEEYEKLRGYEAKMKLLIECADVQQAIETLMHLLGATALGRTKVRRLAWEKNDERGYFQKV